MTFCPFLMIYEWINQSNRLLSKFVFGSKFFIKIAPNLCRHMTVIPKGTKRPSESNVVSPSRRGPRGHLPTHSSHDANPSDAFRMKARTSFATESPRRSIFQEHREEVNVGSSSPGSRSGTRTVSFQDHFESPKSYNELQLNYVSPTSGDTIGMPQTPHLGLKSNRGGARVTSRVIDMGERVNSQPNSLGGFPVSNRGRGMRNVSSRGRSPKASNFRMHGEESPMIIKNLDTLNKIHSTSDEMAKSLS